MFNDKPFIWHKQARTLFFIYLFFWPGHEAGGILVPSPAIEPVTPAVETPSLNHWMVREFPSKYFSRIYKSTVYILSRYSHLGKGWYI